MNPTDTITTGRADAALTEARADAQAQIARTDTKASFLLSFVTALAAVAGAVAGLLPIPRPAVIAAVTAALLLVAAVWVLLSVMRPRLTGRGVAPGSFPHLATLTPAQVRSTLDTDRRADDVAVLAGIAMAKFSGLQRAVDLTRAAVVLLILAAAFTIGGAL